MQLLSGRVILFSFIMMMKVLIIRLGIFPLIDQFPVVFIELASLILIFGLIDLLAPRKSIWGFIAVDFLLTFYLISNAMYYNHFGRFLDYHIISQLPQIKDISDSIAAMFSMSYLFLFIDIFFIAKFRKIINNTDKKSTIKITIASLIIILFAFKIYSPQKNPILFAQHTGIINAQFYQVYNSLNKNAKNTPAPGIHQLHVNNIKQLKQTSWPKLFGKARGKNVILIQLESTENFVVGLSINGQEVTPNLNKLIRESLYFPHFYSQIGQGTTADAEFITNTSIYPLAHGVVSKRYIGVKFPSLPRILQNEGYKAVTFHPNDVAFWRRDNLYPALGFDKYYDKSFYQDEDLVGRWGSSDEVLYQKAIQVLKELRDKKQKFYASLITLSCHHPYNLPESKKHLTLPPNLENTIFGDYLTAVNYQDYALGLFIGELKISGLWDESVLVVYGDHFGISRYNGTESQNLLTSFFGRERDPLDALNIPFVIKVPGVKSSIIENLGGQVDILPTLTNLLGIYLKDDHIIFGQDILNHEHNLLGFRFYYPEGTFISNGVFHLAGNDFGQRIDNHEIVRNKEFFSVEEQRIKTLLQLSDAYLERIKLD